MLLEETGKENRGRGANPFPNNKKLKKKKKIAKLIKKQTFTNYYFLVFSSVLGQSSFNEKTAITFYLLNILRYRQYGTARLVLKSEFHELKALRKELRVPGQNQIPKQRLQCFLYKLKT